MVPSFVDTGELSRSAREIGGEVSLSVFVRLVGDLPPQPERKVVWSLRGSCNAAGAAFLHVKASGSVVLECQRCLGALDWPIEVDRTLQLVGSEEEADAGLADEDPDAIERIVGSPRFDPLALVEDEIILALPYVPMHESCPQPPRLRDDGDADQDPSPFAVLNNLRKN